MRLTRLIAALLPSLFGTSSAMAAGLAFVINSGAASVSVIDMATQTELRRIPMLREPHHYALTPDGKSLLIGDAIGNELLFLDPIRVCAWHVSLHGAGAPQQALRCRRACRPDCGPSASPRTPTANR